MGSQSAPQPGARESPLPFDHRWRQIQHCGGLLDGQPSEEPQLYDPTVPLIDPLQALKRLVQRQQVTPQYSRGDVQRFIKRHIRDTSASFRSISRAGMVHENLPHQSCSDTKEVRTAVPSNLTSVHESEECLVNERSGLECVPGLLSSELTACQPT